MFLLTAASSHDRVLAKKRPPPYRVGVFYGLGANQDMEERQLQQSLLNRLGKAGRLRFELAPFKQEEDLEKAVRARSVDLFQSSMGGFGPLVRGLEAGYKPLFQLTPKGMTHETICLYVSKKSKAKTLKDLKSARLALMPDPVAYFILRQAVGEAPEDFFNALTLVNSAYSGFYALALGEASVALANQGAYNALKQRFPGSVQAVKKLICAAIPLPAPMMLLRPNAPEKLKKKLAGLSGKLPVLNKTASFKKFSRQFSVQPQIVREKDLAPMLILARNAGKKGWMKDFLRWKKAKRGR